jgi:hypothetical protein
MENTFSNITEKWFLMVKEIIIHKRLIDNSCV